MANKIYSGINGVARNVKSIYVGVDGVARKVKKGYVGIDGKARQFYSGTKDTTTFTNRVPSNSPAWVWTINSYPPSGWTQGAINYDGAKITIGATSSPSNDWIGAYYYSNKTPLNYNRSHKYLVMGKVSINNLTVNNGEIFNIWLGFSDGNSDPYGTSFEMRSGNISDLFSYNIAFVDPSEYIAIQTEANNGVHFAYSNLEIAYPTFIDITLDAPELNNMTYAQLMTAIAPVFEAYKANPGAGSWEVKLS